MRRNGTRVRVSSQWITFRRSPLVLWHTYRTCCCCTCIAETQRHPCTILHDGMYMCEMVYSPCVRVCVCVCVRWSQTKRTRLFLYQKRSTGHIWKMRLVQHKMHGMQCRYRWGRSILPTRRLLIYRRLRGLRAYYAWMGGFLWWWTRWFWAVFGLHHLVFKMLRCGVFCRWAKRARHMLHLQRFWFWCRDMKRERDWREDETNQPQ